MSILLACSVQMAIDCVIAPDSIDIKIDDIGGLDKVIKKLVSLAIPTRLNPMLIVQAKGGALSCGHGLVLCLPLSDTTALC